ncbi:MAG: twin-arginine translocase TatA/TatE family subunit [Bdellovibrionota bacterium]
MFGLGFGELIVVFLIALIFIGPKKLPELAKGLGKGIRDFQNAAKGLTDQLQESNDSTPTHTPSVTPTIADATQKDEPVPHANHLDDKDKPQS